MQGKTELLTDIRRPLPHQEASSGDQDSQPASLSQTPVSEVGAAQGSTVQRRRECSQVRDGADPANILQGPRLASPSLLSLWSFLSLVTDMPVTISHGYTKVFPFQVLTFFFQSC